MEGQVASSHSEVHNSLIDLIYNHISVVRMSPFLTRQSWN